MANGEDSTNDLNVNAQTLLLWRLIKFTWNTPFELVIAVIAMGISSYLSLIVPSIIGDIVNLITGFKLNISSSVLSKIDNVVVSDDFQHAKINEFVFKLAVVIFASSCFGFIRRYYFLRWGESLVSRLRNELFKLVIESHDSLKVPLSDMASRILDDAGKVRSTMTKHLPGLLKSLSSLVFNILFMLKLSSRLTAILLASSPVLLYLMNNTPMARRSKRIAKQCHAKMANVFQFTHEVIDVCGLRTVKHYSAEESFELFLKKKLTNIELLRSDWAWHVSLMECLSRIVAGAGLCFVCYWSYYYVHFGLIDIGLVTSFLFHAFSCASEISSISSLYIDTSDTISTSISRIFDIIDGLKLPKFVPNSLSSVHELVVSDLSFQYPNRDNDDDGTDDISFTLSGLSFSARKGQVIGIIGSSGCGKSTLVSLLLGHLKPTSGNIIYKDIDGNGIEFTHNMVSIVNQESVLFTGSIQDNVTMFQSNINRDLMIQACQYAHADGFISLLDGGYDCAVGEKGCELSSGQQQRIELARCWYKILTNPCLTRVMILDEATSCLDHDTERLVHEAITSHMSDLIVIAITHHCHSLIISSATRMINLSRGSSTS